MASGTLYTYPENFRAYKALIAAQYSGARVKVAPDFVFGQTNKSKDFLQKFPLGKVPAFESDDGKLFLTESNAIAFHVANKELTGLNPLHKTLILQWLSFADSEILPASCAWLFPVLGILPVNKKTSKRAKREIKAALKVMNAHLLHNTYLVGERITLADICVACTLLQLYQNVMDPEFRKPFQNVNRWFMTIINQPQVKSVLGDIKLCAEPAKTDPKKYGELKEYLKELVEKNSKKIEEKPIPKEETKAAAPKKETKAPPPKKEAKAVPPKKETKAPAPKEEKKEQEEEPNKKEATESKPNDPFHEIPKGNFDMDDFKRFYSNQDVDKSIPYFWEKFDPVHYSIWFAEYKYPEELQKVFMSCNLITGMYQRLDKMRKNAFASVCLFGTDNDSTISGIWVWRGQNLAFELSPDWQVDYESYDWQKLNPKDPKTKQLVEQYLSWVGTDKNGRKFNQGKIFK